MIVLIDNKSYNFKYVSVAYIIGTDIKHKSLVLTLSINHWVLTLSLR